MIPNKPKKLLIATLVTSVAGGAWASSHREAPFISTRPSIPGSPDAAAGSGSTSNPNR
jgi:hypothetical protein